MKARAGSGADAPIEASFRAPGPVDLAATMAPLRHGRDDPCFRADLSGIWLTRRTVQGIATLHLRSLSEREIAARAWGPGAEAALTAVPGLAGLLDEPEAFRPSHPLLRDLQRRLPGLRLPRTGQLMAALVPAAIEQKVTSPEAHRAWTGLVNRYGEPAPGPAELRVVPEAVVLARVPYFELHPLGLERRRAELVRRLGRLADRIEVLMSGPSSEALARLQVIAGIGPWTAAEAVRTAFGDPDAVSIGDAHLPDLVAWALAGEARADDERMLELLAPCAGQRARAVRLLEASGIRIPRFGPRSAPRRIAGT